MRLLALAACVLAALGCRGPANAVVSPSANARPAAPDATAPSASASPSIREVVVALDPSALAQLASAFERANPGWKVPPVEYPQYRPDLVSVAKRETRGARRETTAAGAEASARAFLAKNASFFGLTTEQAASLRAVVRPYSRALLDPEHHRLEGRQPPLP